MERFESTQIAQPDSQPGETTDAKTYAKRTNDRDAVRVGGNPYAKDPHRPLSPDQPEGPRRLFIPEGDDGVDREGAARRNVASDEGGQSKKGCEHEVSHGIAGADAEEETGHCT